MRNDRVAEFLLGSVTSPERAASMVGDLRETTPHRGEMWFWTAIVRTALALLWRGVMDEPKLTFSLAFRWVWVLIGAEIGAVVIALTVGEISADLSLAGMASGWFLKTAIWASYAAILLCQFQVGRAVARRAEGRELSACLALVMVGWAIDTLAAGALLLALHKPLYFRLLAPEWEGVLSFAGALAVRIGNYNRRSYNC